MYVMGTKVKRTGPLNTKKLVTCIGKHTHYETRLFDYHPSNSLGLSMGCQYSWFSDPHSIQFEGQGLRVTGKDCQLHLTFENIYLYFSSPHLGGIGLEIYQTLLTLLINFTPGVIGI